MSDQASPWNRTERPAARGPVAGCERIVHEVQQAVTAAVRTLLTCQDPRDLHEVLLEVVRGSGGEVLPAGDATTRALDVDLSLGMAAPLLVVPDPHRPELGIAMARGRWSLKATTPTMDRVLRCEVACTLVRRVRARAMRRRFVSCPARPNVLRGSAAYRTGR